MLGLLPYLYRLVPGNPILLRVVATASKRRRDLLTRCAYLGLLILIVLYMLLKNAGGSGSIAELTKTSTRLFQSLSFLQLALVALLAPVFTAGAITQERDSQTYDILLATPLTNGQIVLGTLLSRIFFVVALLVSGIPVFSITQIFGGVALAAIAVSFLIAASTAMVTGALAIAIATLKVGTRRTIFSFYLFIAIYLVGGWQLDRLPFVHPTLADGKPMLTSWVTGLHPFLSLYVLFNQPDYLPPDITSLPAALKVWPLGWYFTSPASFYISSTLLLSVTLVLPSIILLRTLAQSTLTPKTWLLSKVKLAREDRTRPPRSVWNNPIAWREAKTKGSASRAVFLRYGFTALGLIGSIIILVGYLQTKDVPRYITPSSFDEASQTITILDGDKALVLKVPTNPALAVRMNGHDAMLSEVRTKQAVSNFQYSKDTITQLDLADVPRRIPPADARQLILALILVEAAVILLVVTNTAASTVTREKEDGTLDLLLTSPITSTYYIWGKLRGLVYFALPLIAVPTITIALFIVADFFQILSSQITTWLIFPEAILVLPLTLVILATFAAITGMNLSLRCRTTVRAVMFSATIVLGICGLLSLCGNKLLVNSNSDNLVSLAIAAFSPFTVLMALTDPYKFGGSTFTQPDMVASARITLFIFAAISTAAYAAIVWSMYRNMVKNFDMTIRRQSR